MKCCLFCFFCQCSHRFYFSICGSFHVGSENQMWNRSCLHAWWRVRHALSFLWCRFSLWNENTTESIMLSRSCRKTQLSKEKRYICSQISPWPCPRTRHEHVNCNCSTKSLLSNQQRHIMAERNVLLKNVKHPFLVGLHYSFQTRDKLYFVLDFVNGGEVSGFTFVYVLTQKRMTYKLSGLLTGGIDTPPRMKVFIRGDGYSPWLLSVTSSGWPSRVIGLFKAAVCENDSQQCVS